MPQKGYAERDHGRRPCHPAWLRSLVGEVDATQHCGPVPLAGLWARDNLPHLGRETCAYGIIFAGRGVECHSVALDVAAVKDDFLGGTGKAMRAALPSCMTEKERRRSFALVLGEHLGAPKVWKEEWGRRFPLNLLRQMFPGSVKSLLNTL